MGIKNTVSGGRNGNIDARPEGEPVRLLQEKLGVDADGIFDGGTEQALKDYQKANGLSVDGIAGPDTFSAMGLHQLVLLKRGTRGDTVKKCNRH